MKKKTIFNIVFSGISIGLAMVFPFLTGQIPEIGSMLLPIHIPVLICGFICGWKYGIVVGFVSPLLRSLIFTMPPMYPAALSMAFELATYGAISGLLYEVFKKAKLNDILNIFITLTIALIAGRCVMGIVKPIILSFRGLKYSFQVFLADAFINAWPGIILQYVLIPTVMIAIEKTKVLNVFDEQK